MSKEEEEEKRDERQNAEATQKGEEANLKEPKASQKRGFLLRSSISPPNGQFQDDRTTVGKSRRKEEEEERQQQTFARFFPEAAKGRGGGWGRERGRERERVKGGRKCFTFSPRM